MGSVILITTGGTISTADAGAGAVPRLGAADLLQSLGGRSNLPDVDVIEFSRIPGCEMTPSKMVELATVVISELARPDRVGAVVTHGTDTIEESAFVCHLTVPGDKPAVFTGSMRTSSDLSWDGPRNLLDAIRVASAPAARGLGAVLVMNEEIHSARFVTKMNGLLLGAFRSPASGALGRIYTGEPMLSTKPVMPRRLLAPRLEEAVATVRALSGDQLSLEEALVRPDLRGLVVEGFGSGRVPSSWCEPLDAAIRRGVPVVLTSRTGAGAVGDAYGYAGSATSLRRLGAVAAHELPSHKARLKLMLALGNGLQGEALREYFENE